MVFPQPEGHSRGVKLPLSIVSDVVSITFFSPNDFVIPVSVIFICSLDLIYLALFYQIKCKVRYHVQIIFV